MAVSPFTVYLWQQADSFVTLFKVSSGFLGLISVILLVVSIAMSETSIYKSKERNNEITAAANRFFKTKFLPCLASFLFCLLLATAVPSTKTIAVMYAVPAIVNSKPVQQDLPELYDMAVKSLKEQLAPKQEVEKSK